MLPLGLAQCHPHSPVVANLSLWVNLLGPHILLQPVTTRLGVMEPVAGGCQMKMRYKPDLMHYDEADAIT
jgi:hypothetical protein